MKITKNFLVLVMVIIFLSSVTISMQAAPKLKTKHIGFVLSNLDNKVEIEERIDQIVNELNKQAEEASLSKKQAEELFTMSYEVEVKKKNFNSRPDMTYKIGYSEKGSSPSMIYHPQEEKMITLIFPKDKISQMFDILETLLLRDLGLE